MLTFDDGVRDHYDNARPVLERHGIHGIFAPIGLPYLHHEIPFVQKNQLVRGRLGEDGVADAYVAVAEEVAPEARRADLQPRRSATTAAARRSTCASSTRPTG